MNAEELKQRELFIQLQQFVRWEKGEHPSTKHIAEWALEEIMRLRKDVAYYQYRIKEIVPLFEEARDALPAIPLWTAKLRGLRLDLADRMDAAGTRTREEVEAIIAQNNTGDKTS